MYGERQELLQRRLIAQLKQGLIADRDLLLGSCQ